MNLNPKINGFVSKTYIRVVLAFLAVTVLFSSCKRESNKNKVTEVSNTSAGVKVSSNIPMQNGQMVNPYSLKNIRSFYEVYGAVNYPQVLSTDYMLMVKIDPSDIETQDILYLEDTTIHVYNYPINSPRLYDGTATEESIESMKDGYIYTTVGINHPLLAHVPFTVLDTLYKPKETESDFERMLMLHAGYFVTDGDTVLPTMLKWPKPHYPEGNVTYLDEQRGVQPSMGVEVWSLEFGLTWSGNADFSGHYFITHGYWLGTVMGLHYKNMRANIKPLNTTGSASSVTVRTLQSITQVTTDFIVGSRYSIGWVGAGALSNKNIYLGSHNQVRFWAHIMNALYYHDGFCLSENINRGPGMVVVYAHWDEWAGGASTPMLGHMSITKTVIDAYLGRWIFGSATNMSSCMPNLFNMMLGLLPDFTVRASSHLSSYNQYSCEITQTMLHEISHSSHFLRAGMGYWANLINEELSNEGCGYYGCGNWQLTSNQNDLYIQMTEGWAEFLGQNFAKRLYPSGEIFSAEFNNFKLLSMLREDEHFFDDGWICKGVFNDLMDGDGSIPNTESWDLIQGRNIKELFEIFTPTVRNAEEYKDAYMLRFPGTTRSQLDDIFINNS